MTKIIHYCWFGPRPLGKLEKKCLKSWEKYLPDYKIMKWSEENVDLEECEFIKEAYAQKKWAYVADYVRSKALYEYGGIYFDTDMEVIKNMDEFFDKEFVVGLEDSGDANAAIVICKNKKNKYMKKLLEIYQNSKFNETGNLFDIAIPRQLEKVFKEYGFKKGCNEIQVLNGDITIYPREYFYPLSYDMKNNVFTENTHTIHLFSASWTDIGERTAVWLRRHKMGWAVKPAWIVLDKYRRIKKRLTGDKSENTKK
ncbi:MAG: mannosyltransferase [Firmicutes bacterium]|nr:mannosyltransferase [Bacillota bacterium]